MNQQDQVKKEIIRELAADFFSRESNRKSLITVTDVQLLSRGSRAQILITVLPENMEKAALDFASRQMFDFKEFVEKKSRLSRIPFFEIKLDYGEKNRQKIDEIGKNI